MRVLRLCSLSGYELCTLLPCAIADIPGLWLPEMRNGFNPAAFDLHFEDRKSIAFQLFAARQLVRLGFF
jgi:hypothetical protein